MTRRIEMLLLMAALAFTTRAATSEIDVNLRLSGGDFVSGERIRGVVDIANSSPERICVGKSGAKDRFFIEVFRANDMSQLTKVSVIPFVSAFSLESGEGIKLEVFLGDHYALREPRRYLAKPVLVHRGVRFEGAIRAFDIVEGVRLVHAMQMFSNRSGLQREFDLVYWNRNHAERLYLLARDTGSSNREWTSQDLGPILRLEKPSISILPTGEVVILHRLNQDQFVRTEFWSLPENLELRGSEVVRDPETAGTARVREMYKEGGVQPKSNPWWKFW